jgi:hypothetical protein
MRKIFSALICRPWNWHEKRSLRGWPDFVPVTAPPEYDLSNCFTPTLTVGGTAPDGGEERASWQPTLLVNELYLEMFRIKALPAQDRESHNEKAAFLALAAQIMRRLLIHLGEINQLSGQFVEMRVF